MSGEETFAGAEDVMDALLALPPQEFTEARNEAAKRLRAEGNRAAADAVKSLPRPPISLWALNRLARDDVAPIDAFLAAAAKLLEAHRSGGDIRAATAPQREAEATVVSAAAEIVRAEGAKMTDAVKSRLRETLQAAAADADIAAALRAGRLTHEPEAPSLEAILASLPPASPGAKKKSRSTAAQDEKRNALREKIAESKGRAAESRKEARAATDAAEAAQTAWRRAQKLAEQRQTAAETAQNRLQELEDQLEAL
jgi:hypothetical protein